MRSTNWFSCVLLRRMCQGSAALVDDCLRGVQVGRLELPPELQASSGLGSPYLSAWSIPTAGTGSGAIKSRNNLPRAAQVAAS